MTPNTRRVALIITIVVGILSATIATAQSLAPKREYQPVVIEGRLLHNWIQDADIDEINLYRFDGTAFHAIPFQIDKRRLIDLSKNSEQPVKTCEWGYWPEAEEATTEFSSDLLHEADEISFLVRDVVAATSRASTAQWQSLGSADDRYEIVLDDGDTRAKRYVYAFRWPSGATDLNPTDYMQWTEDPTGTICAPTLEACGTASAIAGTITDLPTHEVHFGGNWITDGYRVREDGAGSPLLDDTIDRIRYYATGGENEDRWSSEGSPSWLGVNDGKVRIVRGVQGAMSGGRTTKYEFIYPTAFVSRINYRVHNLTKLTSGPSHDSEFKTYSNVLEEPGRIWSETSHGAGQAFDTIDGKCQSGCDNTQYGHRDWINVLSQTGSGSYVGVHSTPRSLPTPDNEPSSSYADDESQVSFGEYTDKWNGIACTEDAADGNPLRPTGNEDGCLDPEDPGLFFGRLVRTWFPQERVADSSFEPSVDGDEFASLIEQPMLVAAGRQFKGVGGGSCTPAAPTITGLDSGDGPAIVNFALAGSCVELRLFRSVATGPFELYAVVDGDASFTDWNTTPGVQYRYQAVSYDGSGVESTLSNVATVTPTDTTAPPAPVVSAESGDSSAVLLGVVGCTRDTLGVNLYGSPFAGGPYTKMNSAPIKPRNGEISWQQVGLPNGTTYYFVATVVDFHGNESAYSTEVFVTPSP